MFPFDVSNELIKTSITLYDGKMEEVIKLQGGFQNEVYSFKSGDEKRILRITKCHNKDFETLQSELDFIQVLATRGIAVSRPIYSKHGKYIEQLKMNINNYFLSSFKYAAGNLINVSNPNEWNQRFFRNWGQMLGKMHAISSEMDSLFRTFNRPHWLSDDDVEGKSKFILSSMNNEVVAVYENLFNKIQLLPRDNKTYGLIHNDFHQGNFFVLNGQITIFDFDDCAFSWFAQDIAVSFYHAIWQGMSIYPEYKSFPFDFIYNFIEGYREENELTKNVLEQIPLFLKLREIFLFTLFHKHWDILNLQDWQKYTLEDLQYRIEKDIPYTDVQFEKL